MALSAMLCYAFVLMASVSGDGDRPRTLLSLSWELQLTGESERARMWRLNIEDTYKMGTVGKENERKKREKANQTFFFLQAPTQI